MDGEDRERKEKEEMEKYSMWASAALYVMAPSITKKKRK